MKDEGWPFTEPCGLPPRHSTLDTRGTSLPQGGDEPRGGCRGKRHAVNSHHGRIARERARRYLRITDREPGEAGEDPAARPLGERPQGRGGHRESYHGRHGDER